MKDREQKLERTEIIVGQLLSNTGAIDASRINTDKYRGNVSRSSSYLAGHGVGTNCHFDGRNSKRVCRTLKMPFGSFHFRTIKPPNPKNPGNSVPRVLVKPREATPGTLKGILVKIISYPPSARLVVNRGLDVDMSVKSTKFLKRGRQKR